MLLDKQGILPRKDWTEESARSVFRYVGADVGLRHFSPPLLSSVCRRRTVPDRQTLTSSSSRFLGHIVDSSDVFRGSPVRSQLRLEPEVSGDGFEAHQRRVARYNAFDLPPSDRALTSDQRSIQGRAPNWIPSLRGRQYRELYGELGI